MNKDRRLAVLEAFASSKPREFDGFVLAWEQAHPEVKPVKEKTDVNPAPDIVKTEDFTFKDNTVSEASDNGITVQPEPKAVKKTKKAKSNASS
jgi:hypothetical protein